MLKSKQTKQLTDKQMQDYVDKFMDVYRKDKNSRYRSYDHVHCVFLKNRHDNSSATLDYVALHLFAFLGSWGMLCRGAFLLQKDYRFLIPVIKILNQSKYDGLCDVDLTDENLNKSWYIATVMDLIGELKEFFMSQTYYKIEKDKETGVAKNTHSYKEYLKTSWMISSVLWTFILLLVEITVFKNVLKRLSKSYHLSQRKKY